ncbi:MAG: SDR family NAD(P)-dependent oxidoreductase [Pseudomonadota bacterium]
MSENDRLLGLKAVVTGANTGIGDAIARVFAQHQASVLAVDMPDSGVVKRFESVANIDGFECDVSADGATDAVFEEIDRTLGGLDILVNNAGICLRSDTDETADADWDAVFATNVDAAFRLCRRSLPYLKKSPAGRIINVGSVLSELGESGRTAYAASKHALFGMTKSIASEWGVYGITANCLLPGAIMTGMTRDYFRAHKDYRDYWIKKSAARRLGEPLDVARVALFLASDDSVFVSGQGIVVDGGGSQSI